MAAKKTKTVKRTDKYGNEVEVPVGADGKNPVSPENPPAKAVLEVSDAVVAEEKPQVTEEDEKQAKAEEKAKAAEDKAAEDKAAEEKAKAPAKATNNK